MIKLIFILISITMINGCSTTALQIAGNIAKGYNESMEKSKNNNARSCSYEYALARSQSISMQLANGANEPDYNFAALQGQMAQKKCQLANFHENEAQEINNTCTYEYALGRSASINFQLANGAKNVDYRMADMYGKNEQMACQLKNIKH